MLNSLENILNHKFNDIKLLEVALTHSSYANDNNCKSYERMEFLGDTLLQTMVSIKIINYHDLSEGELSKLRAKLVSAKYLEKVANNLNIVKYIRVGKSIKQIPANIKADVVESIIASLYLDAGFEKAYEFVCNNILVSSDSLDEVYEKIVDFKTVLQEKLSSHSDKLKYVLKEKTGPEHNPSFKVELYYNDKFINSFIGKSLKEAEQNCAKDALNKI